MYGCVVIMWDVWVYDGHAGNVCGCVVVIWGMYGCVVIILGMCE